MVNRIYEILSRSTLLFQFANFFMSCLLLFGFIESKARDRSELNQIKWTELQELPAGKNMPSQPGLASPFAGVSNGALIVIGGCNFPERPVYDGGKKRYYSDIFVLESQDDSWIRMGDFPTPIAYGATVTLSEGVLCIGGKNNESAIRDVNLITWNPERTNIEITPWPKLPFSMAEHSATLLDDYIYVAGGSVNGAPDNKFLRLDLSQKETGHFHWEELPDFPGPARLQAIAIGQNAAEESHFYLVSGSSFPPYSDHPYITTDVLEYNPRTNAWSKKTNIQPINKNAYSLHGGSGISMGAHHALFVGGVNQEIFFKAWKRERNLQLAKDRNDTTEIIKLKKEIYDYFIQAPEAYKFNRDVLAYHTITDTWTVIGKYPFPGPAGAPLVKWQNGFVVISGEIKPGLRSPKVYYGRISSSPSFGTVNWIILFLYLIGMLLLGYAFMKRENGTEDFFKGGKRIPWWAAGMSIFATMLSAITFMAIPAKTYATNWLYFMMAVTIFVMAFPVVKYYLPFFRRLNVTTAYEYLELRFNYTVRFLASGLFILFMMARMALVLFLPSLALTTVTGIDIYLCIALMGIITLIYCTMGGVEAVVWGDVIQGFVLLGGAVIAVVFLITGTEGGLNNVIDITVEYEINQL